LDGGEAVEGAGIGESIVDNHGEGVVGGALEGEYLKEAVLGEANWDVEDGAPGEASATHANQIILKIKDYLHLELMWYWLDNMQVIASRQVL
jgi:hypothetical protein